MLTLILAILGHILVRGVRLFSKLIFVSYKALAISQTFWKPLLYLNMVSILSENEHADQQVLIEH